MDKYQPQKFEEKWVKRWKDEKIFQDTYKQLDVTPESKMYLLYAFAYPSGSGLHVGHVEPLTALDILARYYRSIGKKVFFPVGWDAFGLPAENYAIKTGIPPVKTTKDAIDTFSHQIKRIGVSYDWGTEVATCHPGYYRWTQWLFLQLYKKGLAYKKLAPVNWCPSCQTVLANEQVVEGKCERCGTDVIQKKMEQWFFKITDYKDQLIEGLKKLDWPKATKQQQLNWIGKSQGELIKFPFVDTEIEGDLEVFTTRPDTIEGVTFMVISPGNAHVPIIAAQSKNKKKIQEYVDKCANDTDEERQINKDKTGVFTDTYVKNPVTGEKIPVWISNYVLSGYGTGAIMAVPFTDDRDRAFAEKYDLEIKEHGEYKKLVGKKEIQYKLRDWLISRQRYWGAPIPIVYDPQGKAHPVKKENLPWLLPTDVDFKPTGESPLRLSKEFIERVEKLYGKGWTPEYDTMDTFVDSSWYYLRYTDPRNEEEFAQIDHLKKWMPVDFYMIGPEHIVLHLLYSRFFTKFLRDEGYLSVDEPFSKMRHQGMILGPDHRKMSKSKGNVINPDDVMSEYGADALRMYEMFLGPIDADKPWNVDSVQGQYRFLKRVWNFFGVLEKMSDLDTKESNKEITQLLNKTVKKVGDDIEALKFNTAIAAMMEFFNEVSDNLSFIDAKSFLKILSPFAPFMTEEIWRNILKNKTSIHLEPWPDFDENLLKQSKITLPVQINGKVRGTIEIEVEMKEEDIIAKAIDNVNFSKYMVEQKYKKAIYVKGKILNIIV
ncbi:leucine--tRNA ligase [Candidatus Roizmanbacteria bacterium CG_4_10_14_0_2_um_filter_36_9]|uniref:Leucine--tRNA ligase n=1 Tax=Candidatus Roizmanbacteria bacterium CG_4_10_14_0_2_um_filter_36_9 TaxID=1974823 RepID=A0A2M7U495_9BACT|nr:MAG: leucine--tRNA ligase [Candidatus Roizmanbacteria bacterium CG_4_10_14_0_2_um_filter_36_9]